MTDLPPERADEIRRNTPSNLSLPEAAAYLGVCSRTLWNETQSQRIRCARIGRRLIFQRVELDRYLTLLSAASAA